MNKFNELLSNHIANWNMVWFCLIFWGSVFNAIAIQFEVMLSSAIWYLCGAVLGVIAKIRGTWLWKA